jgi:hypothetical protein
MEINANFTVILDVEIPAQICTLYYIFSLEKIGIVIFVLALYCQIQHAIQHNYLVVMEAMVRLR